MVARQSSCFKTSKLQVPQESVYGFIHGGLTIQFSEDTAIIKPELSYISFDGVISSDGAISTLGSSK